MTRRFYEEEAPASNYYLAVGTRSRAEPLPGGSPDLEQMQQEAIATFEQLHGSNPAVMVRVVNEDTRVVEFAVNENSYHRLKGSISERFQRTTSYDKGAVRVTVDQDGAIISKLAGDAPIATVLCTFHQAQELTRFLTEGLAQAGRESEESHGL